MLRYLWPLLPALLFGCRPDPAPDPTGPSARVALSPDHTLVFLDSAQAARAILLDTTDAYFERVRVRDIALQLGTPVAEIKDTAALRAAYPVALAAEVRPFEPAERTLLLEQFRKLFPVLEERFPGLWPARIELVKVTGTHFGSAAFYTREMGIYFPAAQLRYPPEANVLRQILLHELFHLISRRHRDRQADWYATIGFTPPDHPIQLPDSLRANRLLNPDGIPEDWIIRLDSLVALPVIYRADRVAPGLSFSDALQSAYLPLVLEAGRYRVAPPGRNPARTRAFLRLTGGNTNYIIHPDEILAENFLRLFPELTGMAPPGNAAGQRVVSQLAKLLSALSTDS